jgi:hypothetical protein
MMVCLSLWAVWLIMKAIITLSLLITVKLNRITTAIPRIHWKSSAASIHITKVSINQISIQGSGYSLPFLMNKKIHPYGWIIFYFTKYARAKALGPA